MRRSLGLVMFLVPVLVAVVSVAPRHAAGDVVCGEIPKNLVCPYYNDTAVQKCWSYANPEECKYTTKVSTTPQDFRCTIVGAGVNDGCIDMWITNEIGGPVMLPVYKKCADNTTCYWDNIVGGCEISGTQSFDRIIKERITNCVVNDDDGGGGPD